MLESQSLHFLVSSAPDTEWTDPVISPALMICKSLPRYLCPVACHSDLSSDGQW